MAVTAANIQSLIILEVGETDAGALAANMATIWASYADKANIPRLQELYAKRRCIDIAVGEVRQQVDGTTPTLTIHLSQKTERLAAMRRETDVEIRTTEKRYRAIRPASIGTLTTVEPVDPATVPVIPAYRDSSDSRYSGSPYYPGPVR